MKTRVKRLTMHRNKQDTETSKITHQKQARHRNKEDDSSEFDDTVITKY